jgi:hypothetical protein
MISDLLHRFWIDIYVPVWPNIAASAILGVWALRRFIRVEELHKKQHQDHMNKMEEIHDAVRYPEKRKL